MSETTTWEAQGMLQRARLLSAAALGNTLEWFDWVIYAQLSTILSAHFFPDGEPLTALLATLSVFAAGFFARPLGGVLLTSLADRRGRRVGLIVAVSMMAAGSLIIGVAPNFEQAGFFAPALLILARLMQGLSTGGEFSSAATYLAEMAPPKRRGLYGSIHFVSSQVGVLIATAAVFVLNSTLTEAQLNDWGWRIPFVVGGVLGLVTLYLRRHLKETETFQDGKRASRKEAPSLVTRLRKHRTDLARIFVLASLAGVWTYTFNTYLPVYLTGEGMNADQSLLASVIANSVFTISLPFVAILSDRYGRRSFVLGFSAFAAVLAVPLFLFLQPTFATQLVIQTVALLGFAFYAAIGPIAMTEQFPTEIRAVGAGFPYSLGLAVFGGTAPFMLEWLTSFGDTSWVFSLYVAVLAVITFIAMLTLRDRRGERMSEI